MNKYINLVKTPIKRAMSTSGQKPIVLALGEVLYAQEAWDKLREIATVIQCESKNRQEFLSDLKGKYSNVQYITRTFRSVDQTGLFDKELIDALPDSVISISHNGAGYDQVSATELAERKIQLSNVPKLVDNATADTHVFLLLAALRNFGAGHKYLLEGKWPSNPSCAGAPVAHDPAGKTVGILGLGGIGGNILKKLKPFGFDKFVYHNRNRLSEQEEQGAQYVSFDELLAQSDIISINIPLNPKTKHIINADAFAKMKEGVVVVNTARGSVIDETAFIANLKNGKVRSAGVDVMENEPNPNPELYNLDNVFALPHMGTHTVETDKAMEEFVVQNVESAIKTGKVISLVPELRGVQF